MINGTLRHFAALLALLTGLLAAASPSLAGDKLHLKDGRVLEGSLVREQDGYVWFKMKVGALEDVVFFKPEVIAKLERDAAAPEEPKAAAAAGNETPENAGRSGAPRAAIISLGEGGDKDMVGLFMTAESLENCIPFLEKEGVEVLVLRINSGGGALIEIQKLSDVIEYKLKPKFRVVAWIEHAISAAAMTAHCIEEIYFMPGASYGACTGWRGDLEAVAGRQLEEVLFMMEKISARGKHSKEIMRSMQIMDPLSCTIDERGDVTWYQNLDGQYIVNPAGRILTFNSQEALKFKFAKAVVATYEELGRAMGYAELDWLGKRVPGVPYPVCQAEADMRRFRNQTLDDQNRLNEYAREYYGSIQMAQGAPPEDRGKFVSRARQALDKIKRMVRNNENMAIFVLNMLPEQFREWLDEQEEILRRLTRR